MKSGLRDFNLTFGANVLSVLIAIGVQGCLAWNLGPAGKGSYAVCIVFAIILEIVFALGFDGASVYLVSSKRLSLSESVVCGVFWACAASLLAMAVGLALVRLPVPFFERATPREFRIAILTIPFILWSTLFLRLLTAVHEFTWYAGALLIRSVSHLLFAVLFVWTFSWGVEGALIATMVRDLVVIGIALGVMRFRHGLRWTRPSLGALREMAHYGARYYVGKISAKLNVRLGTVILAFFVGRDAIGFFDTAFALASQPVMITDSLIAVILPRIAADGAGRADLVARCFRLVGLVCGTLLVGLALFAAPIIAVVFSPAFLPAVPLLRILAVGVFFKCAFKTFEAYLLGTDHPGTASLSVLIGTVVNLSSFGLLVPPFGLVGAACSIVISHCVSSAILGAGFLRLSKRRLWETVRYRGADLRFLATCVNQVRARRFASSTGLPGSHV
jgi:O-antigen/teichoic acid export membrane protein